MLRNTAPAPARLANAIICRMSIGDSHEAPLARFPFGSRDTGHRAPFEKHCGVVVAAERPPGMSEGDGMEIQCLWISMASKNPVTMSDEHKSDDLERLAERRASCVHRRAEGGRS